MKSYKIAKQIFAYLLTLALLATLVPVMALTAHSADGITTTTRVAVAAAQVGPSGGNVPGDHTNHGNLPSSELRTPFYGGRYELTDWGRNMYLKFDLTGMKAITTDKVMINIYVQTTTAKTRLLLIQHPDTSLTQDTVTASNANVSWNDALSDSTKWIRATAAPAGNNTWSTFDATALVKRAINEGNTEIAFLLFQEGGCNTVDSIAALRAAGGGINANAPNMLIDTIDVISDDLFVKLINESGTRATMLLAIGALADSPSFNLEGATGYNALWKDGKDKVADDMVAGRQFADLAAIKTLFDSRVAYYWANQPTITAIELRPTATLDLPSDFKGDILPNAVTTPPRATGLSESNGKLVWSVAGGDAGVVTLDQQTGVMYLTGKAGQVQIKATAVVGGAVSSAFNLNVEAVPYNNTDQQRYLPPETDRINIDDYLKWPEKVGDANIALWYGNATGAFTFGVDDNQNVSGGKANWLRMNREYGAVFNFNVNPNGIAGNSSTANDWRELLAAGNVIQSHTWSHINHTTNGYTSAQSLYEYSAPIKAIEAITGVPVLAFAGADGSIRIDDLSAPLHSVSRGGSQNPTLAQNVNYLSVNTISGDGIHSMTNAGTHGSREAIIKSVITRNYTVNNQFGQPTNYYGGWSNIFTHAWGAGTEPLYRDWVKPAVDAGLLWTESLVEVGLYAQERDTAVISNITNNILGGSYSFDLTDEMADDIFDRPLTIKVNVGATWTGVTAKQNGVDIPAKIVTNTSGTFAMVDAVPDKGLIVLTGTNTYIVGVTVMGNSVDVAINDPVNGSVVVVAIYYGSKLIGLKAATVTGANMSLPIVAAGSQVVKALLWDSLDTMNPMCPAKVKQWSGGNWVD